MCGYVASAAVRVSTRSKSHQFIQNHNNPSPVMQYPLQGHPCLALYFCRAAQSSHHMVLFTCSALSRSWKEASKLQHRKPNNSPSPSRHTHPAWMTGQGSTCCVLRKEEEEISNRRPRDVSCYQAHVSTSSVVTSFLSLFFLKAFDPPTLSPSDRLLRG